MDFEYDEAGMSALLGSVDELVEFVTRGLARQARNYCPRRTGDLLDSIVPFRNKVYCGGPKAPHWAYVEFGTPAHDIRPRTKQALYWKGASHPVTYVRHPGTPEFAFMRRALYNNQWLSEVLA